MKNLTHLKNFNKLFDNKKINEKYLKDEKIVELDIVDMDKEESVCSIKILLSNAKKIERALHNDRIDGGKYRVMFDETKDFRYWG